MIAEALLDFQNSALVQGGTNGSVFVVLHDKRIHKAVERIGAWRDSPGELRAAQGIWVARGAGARIPVPVGDSFPVSQRNGAKWRSQQIGVNGGGESDGMRVDVTGGDRESRNNLALNSKLGLLRIWRSKIRLVDENHLKRTKGTAIGDTQPQPRLPKQGRGNASAAPRRRCRASDRPLSE